MKKRVLSLFLAFVLCLTLLPTSVFAEGADGSAAGAQTEDNGQLTNTGESKQPNSETDTQTEIWCTRKPSSIQRGYDGTTDGSTIPIDLTFTDGTDTFTLKEGTGFTAKKTFDSADAGSRTVTVEIELIGDAAAKYKLRAGEESFTIGGYINKAYPKLNVSLSRTTCTVGEKILPLLSVEGAPEGAEVTYYYLAAELKNWAGSSDAEGGTSMPAIDGNTAISEPGTYYVYAKTGKTKNYEEERSTTAELTVNEAVVKAASVTKADGTDGGTYESLPAALNAARDGDTVNLLENHTTNWNNVEAGEEQMAVVRTRITLDLNGNTVDYLVVGEVVSDEEGGIVDSYDGNLTVQSSQSGGTAMAGQITTLKFVRGTLAVQDGVIIGSSPSSTGLICEADSGTVTISGGIVYNATVGEGAAVTVSGGLMHKGRWTNYGTLNITGGTFGSVEFYNNGGTIAISGGTFNTLRNFGNESEWPIAPMSLLAPGHAFYKDNAVQDGSIRDFLQNVTVKEHTHTMVNNKCACGLSCTHTDTEGASTISKDGKCTVCGTQFAAVIGETYYTDVPSALDAAADGQTIKLLANGMLPSDTYVSKTLTLDLDGHSLSGYSLNVGGLTAMSQVRTGKLTVIDSSAGNGAVGVAVRDGGTLVFNPKNDSTTLLQLEVYGGTVALYGGKISRNGLRLNNGITLGNLLPGNAGLAYYRGDTQLTLEEAASQTCDLVVKSCSHGGKNGFDNNSTTCPYCNAPAVAETALNNGEGNSLWRRFANLQTAIDADRDGGAEFKLLTDVTGDYTIDGTQDTALDLNGHSIKGTVTVKGINGDYITTTLSNTQNTTTASIDEVVAFDGAELAGSKFPAVIGELTLADGATWKTILNDTALGYKVLNTDGTHKWYARDDVKGSQLNNVIINRLPITSKTLYLKVDGKNLTGSSPKVERGTTVQLCASCNAKDVTVTFSILKTGETTPITLSGNDVQYTTVGTGTTKFYVAEYAFNDVGSYTISFTATKDGYTVTSTPKKLTVTKPNLSNAVITFPNGNEAAFNYATSTGVPMFVVKYNGTELEKDVDYTISSGGSTYDVGPCTLTIKATDNGDYTGSKSADWKVRPLKVAASVGDIIKTYDGTTDLPANAKITFKSADSYYTGATLRLAKGTDYEVLNAHYDSADASQEEKTISFTVKLKNEGYVFEDGTTQKDFTLNGAELEDKSFKINKAAAPTNIPTGTLNVINGTYQTYTYDFSKLLPELSKGEYGTISYGNQAAISLVSQSGYYYDETIVEFKNGLLTLAQFYAKDGTMTGQIGTVKVKVTTTNYEDFQLTLVLNAINKIKPTPDGKITASKITYGQALSDSSITGKMKDPNTGATVNGTFTWTDGTIKPHANDRYEAEWTFNPDSEEYATVTDTATVEVAPKSIEGAVITLEADSFVYDGNEKTPVVKSVVLDNVTLTSLTDYGYIVVKKSNVGIYNFTITGNGNYTGEVKATWQITARKVTPAIEVASCTYTGDALEPTVTLKDGNEVIPTDEYTVEYSNNTNAGTGRVTIKDVAGGNYVIKEKTQDFTITKATAPVAKAGELTITNGLHKTYSFDLSTLLPKLTAPCDYGTITYDKKVDTNLGVGSFITLVNGKTGELTLEANRSGTDEGQFGTITVTISTSNYQDITLTVNIFAKNKLTPVMDGKITASKITYGDTLSKSEISGKMKDPNTGDEVKGTFSWKQPGDTILDASTLGHSVEWTFTPTDENTYTEATGTATVKVDKAQQYGEISMAGYSYGGTPSTPTLTDRTGDPNAQVIYNYSAVGIDSVQTWDIENPPALNAGTYRMFAQIVATNNYYDYNAESCVFVVTKATPPYTKPTDLTAKYGQTLADVALPDGWSWMESSESVGGASTAAKTFKAKFTPTDSVNYNVAENIELEVTVNKADQAALTVQGADSVLYGQTLTLTASGGSGSGAVTYRIDTAHSTGEATIDPETGVLTPVKVGSVSVIATKAGDNDYNDVTSAHFVLMIKPATPTGAPKYTEITTSGKTLKDAALTTNGSTLKPNDGKLEWVDDKGNVLPDDTRVEANTTYKWRFTPTDTNYTTLTGEIELYRKSSSGGGGWYYSYYTIKATAGAGGSISPSGNVSVREGADQTFTITPDKGYAVSNVKIDGKSIGAVKSYTFENVRRTHTIEVIFMKANGNPQTVVFVDVATGSYYEDAVDWAVENGITQGTDDTHFAPDGICTRAQAVTFLWRTAGSPEPETRTMPFTDVPVGSYYYDAVLWAVENGITKGTSDTTFSPNMTCSRAQIVTFLWRSEKSPAAGTANPFADVKSTAYYADAVLWAVKEDITKGTTNTTFSPDADCTRAQIVTFLWRCKK